jgi:hypothetical protein
MLVAKFLAYLQYPEPIEPDRRRGDGKGSDQTPSINLLGIRKLNPTLHFAGYERMCSHRCEFSKTMPPTFRRSHQRDRVSNKQTHRAGSVFIQFRRN